MTTKDFQLPFALDAHISFVSGLILEAGRYHSKIEICCGDKCLDAKSFMSVMYASISPCTCFTLRAEGDDEQQALERLSAYMDGFR